MKVHFNDSYLQRLFEGRLVAGKPRYSKDVVQKFTKTILLLKQVDNSKDLKAYKGLNFEPLKGKLSGLYSVRVDYKYRLLFRIINEEMVVEEVILVEELSNHYQ